MIYSQFGSPIEIVANCGEHRLPGFPQPVVLVRAIRADQKVYHCFSFTLKADGGLAEIAQTIEAAPTLTLSPLGMRAAMHQAN